MTVFLLLPPECGEESSYQRVDDQCQYKVITEHPVMNETYRGEPTGPDRVACRRLGRSRLGHAFDRHHGRLVCDEDKEHHGSEEMDHKDQVKRDEVRQHNGGDRDETRCGFTHQHG